MPPPTIERTRLIAEVLAFVHAARRLPGITRIALFGSLTTSKADPKDIDLLVTVTDDTDLAPLANLTRKLQGHAQQMNRGGEVSWLIHRTSILAAFVSGKSVLPVFV